MNLRRIDLNLLVVFDALLAERNVTHAANRVAMSQSAVSNALARLRVTFKDDLFVRTKAGMEPTERALELAQLVGEILRRAERLMLSDLDFEPADFQHLFRVRMSDLVGYLVLPVMMQSLHDVAPGVRLDVVHLGPEETIDALNSSQIDFAVSMNLSHGKSIQSAPLFEDQMVCIMRRGHRLAGGLTLEAFLDAGHVRVTINPADTRFIDNTLGTLGRHRNVQINVPHWLMVPPVLRRTDLLAVMSRRLVECMHDDEIVARPLPVDSPPFQWRIYWHRRHGNSVPHRWVREVVRASCRTLQQPG